MKKVLLFSLIAVLFTACMNDNIDRYTVKVGKSVIKCKDFQERKYAQGDTVCVYTATDFGNEWVICSDDTFKDTTVTITRRRDNVDRSVIFRYRLATIIDSYPE